MENDLSRVFDAIPGLVWSAGPDGSVDFLNQRWCDYTGMSLQEACGLGWRAAIHPDGTDRPRQLVIRTERERRSCA